MLNFMKVILLVLVINVHASANPLTLNEILHATCRVSVSGAMGSGTACHEDNNYVYVLTNAHVVGGNRSGHVEFFPNGRKTPKIPAEVILREHQSRTDVDFAVMRIAKSSLPKDWKPRIIPFAPQTYRIERGTYIASAGHPSGRWAQAWEGYALSDANSRVLFTPPPLGGQSGSGIFVVIDNYTYLAAVVTWRIGNDGRSQDGHDIAQGGGVLISTFQKIITGSTSHIPNKIPDHWEEVSEFIINRKAWALGSDGKIYPITYFSNGSYVANGLPVGKNVQIVQWHITDPTDPVQCPNCPGVRPRPNPLPRQPPSVPDGGGFQPPRLNPNPSPFEGGGRLPPGFGQTPPPQGSGGEIENLKNENEELRNALEDAVTQLRNTQGQVLDLNNQLSKAKGDLSVIESELKKAEAEGESAIEQIGNLRSQINEKQNQIGSLSNTIANKNTIIIEKHNEVINLQKILQDNQKYVENITTENKHLSEKNEVVIQNNSNLQYQNATGWSLFGVTTFGGVLYYIGRLIYLRRVRPKIDKIQDKIIGIENSKGIGTENIIGVIRELIEKVENKSLDKIPSFENIIKKLDEKQDQIQEILESRLSDKIGLRLDSLKASLIGIIDSKFQITPEEISGIYQKVDNLVSNVNDVIKQHSESTANGFMKIQDEFKRVHNIIDNINNNPSVVTPAPTEEITEEDKPYIPEPSEPVSPYIIEFGKQCQSDGQDLQQWAMYGQLYQEAVDLMRRSALYYNGKNDLQGQRITAQKLEDWVQNEYAKRMNQQKIMDYPAVYHKAYVGFLYKEAVNELRQGKIAVLGAKRTADAIDIWVRDKLLERMKIK